jgi:hypothetical protein
MPATVSDGRRLSTMQKSLVGQGFLAYQGDDWRWCVKLDEGGLGALGEIRTPDPRNRNPMLYPAELRARR